MRPLRRDDAPALVPWWNRTVPHDPLTPPLLEEKVWADAAFDPSMALLLESADGPKGVAVGVLRERADGLCGYVKLLAVDAGCRRQGIGGRLLAALEGAMRARGAAAVRVGESAPNYLAPGVDMRYTAGLLFFEKHGYRRLGHTYNLTVDLHASDWATGSQEARHAAAGYAVRRAGPGDRPAVMAFLQQHWPPWQAEVAAAFGRTPISLHLALRGAAVVAFAAYDANNVGTGWFGPMGTDPAARGQGLGATLLHRCLHDQKAQGHRAAIIPWVGPVGFYAHHAGAEIARLFYRYEKNLHPAVS